MPAADLPPIPEYQPISGDFDSAGKSVLRLLQAKDAAGFAKGLSASTDDWHSLISSNTSSEEAERLNNYAKGTSYSEKQLESSAKAVLDRANSLHLDFSKGNWHFKIVMPEHTGRVYLSTPAAGGSTLPYVEKLEVIVASDAGAGDSAQGDFKLAVRGVEKFPTGWRASQGIQWVAFPTNLVDPKTTRELGVLDKIADYKGFTGEDDPALLKLGETLVRFVRERDTGMYQKELLMNSDLIWDMYQKSGRPGPSRKEVDDTVKQHNEQQVQMAQAMTKMMDDAGIDLKNADIQIKSAAVERGRARQPGSLDSLTAEQFTLALSVKTDAKAKSGAPLAGDYVLAAKSLMRFGDDWKIMEDVRWDKLPDGVVDSKVAASMDFEKYVAEYGTLPLNTAAPEIEFTALDGGKKLKLSDLRGKVVILDFWATWCGPCQEPMADLQKLRQGHDDWQGKVAIVPLSIDDTIDIVRNHVDQRGWTNTFNVWAGDGGWFSTPAKTFRVTGVPTSYVIDQQGKIFWAGHPAGASLGEIVDALLKSNGT